uniref:Piercer of microtubule wall 1 n=1 Tax=Anser brachyrhynchus TaxID=132585 RepID=A0A8B9CZU4_9AVES
PRPQNPRPQSPRSRPGLTRCVPPRRQPHPLYRTSSQAYGSRAPTVHEVPCWVHFLPHGSMPSVRACGMYRNNGLNTYLEKSHVTGPDNFITPYDTVNFHPSYNASRPSYC